MATDATLQELALELMADFDSTIDTSEGSPFRTKFLTPFLTRVGGNPLDGDLETFLVSRLETEIPSIDVSPLAGMRDLVIRACTAILAPFRREISALKLTQSLSKYQSMTRAELNALLANFFTELREGSVSVGIVRMLFPSPRSVTVTPLTQFSTGTGLNFFPQTAQSLTSVQMSFNQDGSLFFMDILVQAESPGEAYNLEPDSITSVIGINGVTRVTNLGKFEDGLSEETKDEGVARTQNSITIRNLITDRGVKFVLPENFPAVETLQVIGHGDPEMDRDVVYGPVAISDIPGGITGKDDPGLGGGEQIHIGGKTDIYVYQAVPDQDDVDIEDLTDKGFRIFAGVHGYTDAGSPTTTFKDDFGFFDKRGVAAGDFLLLDNLVNEVVTVGTSNLEVIDPLDASQFGKVYEIIRKVPGFLTVPLYDLVAEDADGNPVIDADDDPICPIPGSTTKVPLVLSSVEVKKSTVDWSSIARSNVKLPLLRVVSVERLDPITLEGSALFIPMRDPILAVVIGDDFAGGTVSTKAQGTIRVYFRDPVNAWVTRADTRFLSAETFSFRPITEVSGTDHTSTASGTSGGNTITLTNGNFSAAGLDVFRPGYRIEIPSGAGAGTYTVVSGVFSTPNTILTIREDLPATFSLANWGAHVGRLESTDQLDETLGLSYLDVEVEAMVNGTNMNLAEDTPFPDIVSLDSEGWSLETTKNVTSFSTRELPYIQFTEWVSDDLFLGDPLDAPAVRVSYEHASTLKDLQTFADAAANRIVAEEVLIRHYLPAYVRTVAVIGGISVEDSKERVVEFINALDPLVELQVSDVIGDLTKAGVTSVELPLFLVSLAQDSFRNWTGLISQNTLGSNRIQHFIADESAIVIS